MRKLLISISIVFCNYLFSQDTVKIMTYNLLNYNNFPSYCTVSNNNTSLKDGYLRTIFSYEMPDIFGVNEVSGSGSAFSQHILDSVINVNGITWYNRINYVNSNSSDIISTLFYDSRKFTLYNQNYINGGVRDILINKFYYKSPDVSTLNDTVFITCIVMHLKAGSNPADLDDRAAETLSLMNYLNSMPGLGNCIVMGDFNVQTNTETCFQNLINYSNPNVRFYDPVNKLGNWNNNSAYVQYHTQSTNTDAGNTCKVSGGLDDRFDFILASFYIMNDIAKISYVPGSYWAVGQDGNRFNQSIVSPANYSVPSNVVSALGNMSDHLPVVIKLRINQTPVFGVKEIAGNQNVFVYENPVDDYAKIEIYSDKNEDCVLTIYDRQGRRILIKALQIHFGYNFLTIPVSDYNKGMYLFNFINSEGISSLKIIKK